MIIFFLVEDDEHNSKIRKSVCMSYTVMLLLLIVRHSNNIPILVRYGAHLVSISEQDIGGKMAEKLSEMQVSFNIK